MLAKHARLVTLTSAANASQSQPHPQQCPRTPPAHLPLLTRARKCLRARRGPKSPDGRMCSLALRLQSSALWRCLLRGSGSGGGAHSASQWPQRLVSRHIFPRKSSICLRSADPSQTATIASPPLRLKLQHFCRHLWPAGPTVPGCPMVA
jgi:hypothetical protein